MSVISQIEQTTKDSQDQKKGFFELPYLANSPELMIEQFKTLTYTKYDESRQSISAKTPFLNIITYHRQIPGELFIIYSEVTFKTNVCFKYHYDKNLPFDYYCLSLRTDYYSKNINSLANGIGYSDNSWLIFKPGAKVDHHHFKGTTGKYLSVYFTKEWLENNIIKTDKKASKELAAFINSDRDYLICPHLTGTTLFDIEELSLLFTDHDLSKPGYFKKLKAEMMKLLLFFTAKMQAERIDENHFQVSNLERIRVLQVEHFLKGKTLYKFPGISYLAQRAGLSETKLKECFKIIYGKTLLQYFQAIQMERAQVMIINTKLSIAQIAKKFCYINASKFTAAFKKYHGILPSEVLRSNK